MGAVFNEKTKGTILKGNTFFKKGNTIEKIGLLISGQVCAKNEYISITLESGALLGVVDSGMEAYIFDYEAVTDITILLFAYSDSEDIKKIFELGVSYQELAVTSAYKQFNEMFSLYTSKIEPYVKDGKAFDMLTETDNNEVDLLQCQYLTEISSLKKEVYHGLFTQGDTIPYVHMMMLVNAIKEIHQVSIEVAPMIQEENKKAVEEKNTIVTNKLDVVYSEEQINVAINELSNATQKILEYAQIDAQKAARFQICMTQYHSITHLDSLDDMVRRLKSQISELYYEIYEKVFLRTLQDTFVDKVIILFLNYGLMDETAFKRETLVELYYLNFGFNNGKYSIYTIYQWLYAIYNGEKEPSKNEFDLDYKENLRELKKSRKFTAQEENLYLSDQSAKVHFEIMNLFRITNRLTSGEVTRFCPILSQRDIARNIDNMIVDSKRIECAMNDIMKIDFSLFYREQMYYDEDHKIDKIYVMKEVLPDIILMPNVGSRGIMWQDISASKRDNPGRFVLPILTVENLENILLYVVASFRWELCRTIQASHWNDIRDRSLTSEYCDYIQFYRKNKDLSEDAKARIKSQFQNCKNSYREMFIKDYETWIKYEAKGSIRLNKCARKILFIYCPFAKEFRDKVGVQPIYVDAVAQFGRERAKKIKELKNHYKAIENNNGTITQLLIDNLKFYEEM